MRWCWHEEAKQGEMRSYTHTHSTNVCLEIRNITKQLWELWQSTSNPLVVQHFFSLRVRFFFDSHIWNLQKTKWSIYIICSTDWMRSVLSFIFSPVLLLAKINSKCHRKLCDSRIEYRIFFGTCRLWNLFPYQTWIQRISNDYVLDFSLIIFQLLLVSRLFRSYVIELKKTRKKECVNALTSVRAPNVLLIFAGTNKTLHAFLRRILHIIWSSGGEKNVFLNMGCRWCERRETFIAFSVYITHHILTISFFVQRHTQHFSYSVSPATLKLICG